MDAGKHVAWCKSKPKRGIYKRVRMRTAARELQQRDCVLIASVVAADFKLLLLLVPASCTMVPPNVVKKADYILR